MSTDLTKYLLERRSYGDRQNPLEEAVKRELVTLTQNLAHEVIAEDPAIGVKIRNRIHELVVKALAADADLNQYVTEAVAKALASRALQIERERDEET